MQAPLPADEASRLQALRSYRILDTPPEETFEGITRLIAHICKTPIAVVTFIDEGRQWFKSEIGLGVRQTPLDISLCAHAILQPGLFIVPDTTLDPRFRDNPLVTAVSGLRFYAGALLETTEGQPLGTLCVLDRVPRELTAEQTDALTTLSKAVMALLETRRSLAQRQKAEVALRQSEARLRSLNGGLELEVAARIKDLREKENELQQSRKMEALGRLAAGVAHDFNNLISGIRGISIDLRDSLELTAEQRDDFESILAASDKAVALTKQLLTFSRQQTLEPTRLNVHSKVASLTTLLGRLLGPSFELRTDFCSDEVETFMDATLFEQILFNLVLNARDAMPNGGPILIATAIDDQTLLLRVKDVGHGIENDTLQHLFEPFFTTKEPGKGTGLGLATVYGIVHQSGGTIDVQTEVGRGTTFTVRLPLAASATNAFLPSPTASSIVK